MRKLKFEPNIWITFKTQEGTRGIGRTGYVRDLSDNDKIVPAVAVTMEDFGTGCLPFDSLLDVKKLNILTQKDKTESVPKQKPKANQSMLLPYFGEIGEA